MYAKVSELEQSFHYQLFMNAKIFDVISVISKMLIRPLPIIYYPSFIILLLDVSKQRKSIIKYPYQKYSEKENIQLVSSNIKILYYK